MRIRIGILKYNFTMTISGYRLFILVECNHESKAALNLVHGWDRNKNVHVYSFLGLSTHKNVKCYPTMTKGTWLLHNIRII